MISWLFAIAAARVGLMTRCRSFGLTLPSVALLIWMAAVIKPFLMNGVVLSATSHLPPPAELAVAVCAAGQLPLVDRSVMTLSARAVMACWAAIWAYMACTSHD